MTSTNSTTSALTLEERLSRAQVAYREYSCRCFWFMDKDLIVTEKNFPLIIEGLKLHGGHKGWKLAHELCRTEFQAEVFKVISSNRNPESYVAGGIVIHRDAASTRYSRDIDLFHDTAQAVAASAKLDSEELKQAGYKVDFTTQEPMFYRADVAKGESHVRLEWAADSAFRFFPVVPDEVLGFRLHDADVTTNKVLAAAGRVKVRDFIDLIHLNRTYVSLGVAVWAASGKDEGYTPELILEQLRRNSRINPDSLEGVKFTRPIDPVVLKKEWMDCLHAVEALMATFPSDPLGCLYLDKGGQLARGDIFDPAWTPHFGSVKGAWPKIGE